MLQQRQQRPDGLLVRVRAVVARRPRVEGVVDAGVDVAQQLLGGIHHLRAGVVVHAAGLAVGAHEGGAVHGLDGEVADVPGGSVCEGRREE